MGNGSRRDFLKGASAAGVSLAAGLSNAQCGSGAIRLSDGGAGNGEGGRDGAPPGGGDARGSDGDAQGSGGDAQGSDASGTRPGESYDCIVVGAGTAGLASAFRLYREGHQSFRVFEKYSAAGGICGAEEEHGYRFPMGTTYISLPWPGSAVRQLYNALRSERGSHWYTRIPYPFDSMFKDGVLTLNATVFGNWDQLPGVTTTQSRQCADLRDGFLELYDECEWPPWRNRDGALHEYEMMTLRQLINRMVPNPDPWILGCLESFTRGVLNGSLAEVGALQGIDMLGDEYESWVNSEPGEDTPTIVGADTYVVADLVDAMIAVVGQDRVALNAEVLQVERVGDVVEVTVQQGDSVYRHRCNYCIVATNARAARGLIRDLPPAVASVLDSISYGEYSVVNLVLQNHTVGINSYDCTLGANLIDDIYDFTFISKSKRNVPLTTPPQVLGCYIAAEHRGDHRPTMPEADLVNRCLGQIDTMFGEGTRSRVTSTHVRQYEQGMPIFHPGLTWQQERHLMPMFNQRIILAGDYVQGSPTVEGAVEAGWYAGERVAEEL